ncbi:MAG TPA: Gfo/Idh/MocA family oxidoreductase, partial [Tepidisphaeraceae bacterium]|nr:Gfo/Idh/MocA family oxidoreductase [Tepidisphaeraceae bacterium]
AEAAAEEYGTQAFHNLKDLLPMVAAATIAVPTKYHADLAEPFLRRGVACLIEKPLAKDVFDCRRIIEASHRFQPIVQVGHIERFNPAVRAMRKLDIRPQFMEVTRISPLTFRSIDVGVVLDMMIHDIDIVLSLAGGSEVTQIDAVGVSVIGDVEDICNARLTFANGCVANITASRLAMKTERKLRVFSQDAYVSLDYGKRYGMVAHRGGNVDAIREAVARIRSGEVDDLSQLNFGDLINIEELKIDDTEPIRAELDEFVDAVMHNKPSPVPAEDGMRAVEIATKIVEKIGGKTV